MSYDDPSSGQNQPTFPTPEHAMAVMFKDFVEANTGGMVKLELFGAGSLGSYRETCEMVQNGSLDINIGTGSLGTFFAPFQIFTIPTSSPMTTSPLLSSAKAKYGQI